MQSFPSVAVIRVINHNNYTDEFACITLASGTFHQENSFSTVLHTQANSSHPGNLEKDLQTIHGLLNNRIWFAFDIESAVKILQRLYENVNQSPPQSLGLLEASQIFQSNFFVICDSVATAAQYLQISPWETRSINARVECDITYEVLNRIALKYMIHQWITPNQSGDIAPSSSDDQNHKHQEIMTTQNEPVNNQHLSVDMNNINDIVQTYLHPHHHSTNENSYDVTNTTFQLTETITTTTTTNNNTTEIIQESNDVINIESHHLHINNKERNESAIVLKEEQHHTSQEYNTNNTDAIQFQAEEANADDTNENKEENGQASEEFDDEYYECPYSPKQKNYSEEQEPVSNLSHQNENFHTHDSNSANATKKDDSFASANANIHQIETEDADIPHSQEIEHENHSNHTNTHARVGQASWKDLAMGKQTQSPSNRVPQLYVVPGVRNKKIDGQTWFKPFPPTRDLTTIKQYITNAMANNRTIWISYDGGNQPLIPRGVKPIRWDDHPGNDVAFFGVPHHSKTGKQSRFFLQNVKEVRDKYWLRPEDAKQNRNKNQTNKVKRSRIGSTDDEKLNSNGTNNVNTENNTTDHSRSKHKTQ